VAERALVVGWGDLGDVCLGIDFERARLSADRLGIPFVGRDTGTGGCRWTGSWSRGGCACWSGCCWCACRGWRGRLRASAAAGLEQRQRGEGAGGGETPFQKRASTDVVAVF